MKLLRTFSGSEHLLEDDEAANLNEVKGKPGLKAWIELRDGTHLDSSAIESIGPIPLVPSRHGSVVNKSGWYVRDGQRICVEDWREVKYIPDPRYANKNQKMLE